MAWLFRGLEVGVFLSFLGAYLSVSLIGLGTALVLLCGLSLVLMERRYDVFKGNPLFLPMALLIAAILISIALAQPYDFEKPLGKTRYLVCFFFFAWYFCRKPQGLRWVLRTAQVLAPLLALIAVLQFTGIWSPLPYFGGHEPSPLPYGEGRFFLATGFAFHHNPFASTLVLLFHVFLAHWFLGKVSERHVQFGLPALACVVGIFCSFSRGAWVAWAVSTLLVAALVQWKFLWRALIAITAFALVLFSTNSFFRSRLLDIRFSRNEDRLELWRICYEMFKEAPVFGHGFYSFGSRYQGYTTWHLTHDHFPVEAHNMYLDLLSGAGLVGFCSFLFLLIQSAILAVREFGRARGMDPFAPWALASLGCLCSFGVAGLFDKQFYMTQTLVPNLFFLGILSSKSLSKGGVWVRGK